MARLIRKTFDKPDEVRPFDGATGQLEVLVTEEGSVGRATFLPGWKWSEYIKPIAKTDSCQAAHPGYFISGRMKAVMDDGAEIEYGPGDFAITAARPRRLDARGRALRRHRLGRYPPTTRSADPH